MQGDSSQGNAFFAVLKLLEYLLACHICKLGVGNQELRSHLRDQAKRLFTRHDAKNVTRGLLPEHVSEQNSKTSVRLDKHNVFVLPFVCPGGWEMHARLLSGD